MAINYTPGNGFNAPRTWSVVIELYLGTFWEIFGMLVMLTLLSDMLVWNVIYAYFASWNAQFAYYEDIITYFEAYANSSDAIWCGKLFD